MKNATHFRLRGPFAQGDWHLQRNDWPLLRSGNVDERGWRTLDIYGDKEIAEIRLAVCEGRPDGALPQAPAGTSGRGGLTCSFHFSITPRPSKLRGPTPNA
jgi:hypothetical protein